MSAAIVSTPRFSWLFAILLGLVLTLTVAHAPLRVTFAVLFLATVGALTSRYGVQRGLWYLLVATIPLREPLGLEIVDPVTLHYGDLLLYAMFAAVVWEQGISELWRRSPTLRLAIVVLALSVLGLYTAPSLLSGVAQVQRITGQILVFYLVRVLVRDGREAARTLVAFVLGLLPAVAYGLYQTTIPIESGTHAEWVDAPIAVDVSGETFFRIFSTFNNPLRFSHALSTGFGLVLGLLSYPALKKRRLPLAAAGAAIAMCNRYTYSLSGILGMIVAAGAATVVTQRRRALLLAPFALALVLAVTPNAVYLKASQMLSGQSTSMLGRIVTYQRTWMILADHPFTGVGWGSVGSSIPDEYLISRFENISVGSESYFLHRAQVLGLPGLALFLAIFGLFARNLLRGGNVGDAPGAAPWPRKALLVGGAAFFAQAMLYPVGGVSVGYLLWLILGLAEGMYDSGRARVP